MSNIIPPLLSDSPPPPPSPDEEDDDEFGDFTGVIDCSYSCDNLSLPPTPEHSPTKLSITNGLDFNFNGEDLVINNDIREPPEKDYHDKRKKDSDMTVSHFYSSHGDDDIEDVNSSLNSKSDTVKTEALQNVTHPNITTELCESKHCKIDPRLKTAENNMKLEHSQDTSDISCKRLESIPPETNQTLGNSKLEDSSYSLQFKMEIREDNQNVDKACSESGHDVISVKSYSNVDLENEDADVYQKHNSPNLEIFQEAKADSGNSNFDVNSSDSNLFEIQNVENSFESCADKQENNEPEMENKNFTHLFSSSISSNQSKQPTEIKGGETEISGDGFAEFDNFVGFGNDTEQSLSQMTQQDQMHSLKAENRLNDELPEFEELSELAFTEPLDTCSLNDVEITQYGTLGIERGIQSEEDKEFSDFAEFSSFDTHISANFEKREKDIPNLEPAVQKSDDSDDDFGEFTEFSSHNDPNIKPDDFGDFAAAFDDTNNAQMNSYTEVSTIDPVLLLMDEKEAFDKANTIVKEMFPECPVEEENFEYFAVETDDFVFNGLRDITDTPALAYQWSKSASQKMLLNSLNIDARNILYGPSWNPTMPRFAANLSLEPLEPVKTESANMSFQKDSPNSVGQQAPVEIPSVQFDWNSSGLTNPLDSIPKDQMEAAQDTLPSTSKPDIVSASLAKLAEASKATDSKEMPEDHDFAPFQSSSISDIPQTWSGSVPLRETYISSDNRTSSSCPKESALDVEAWLQPTILTPELPRKKSLENTNVAIPEDLGDDFDDFQAAITPSAFDQQHKENAHSVNEPSILNDAEEKLSIVNSSPPASLKESIPCDSYRGSEITAEPTMSTDDDDFTEFQFSTPIPQAMNEPSKSFTGPIPKQLPVLPVYEAPKPTNTVSKPIYEPMNSVIQPLKPILEPLKPVPAYKPSPSQTSAHINWPDPGITEEDLKKFEEVFKQPVTSKPKQPVKVLDEPPKNKETTPGKSPVVEDDEWTDFISVKKVSPVHKVKGQERENMSSPDLPLSVFNLGSIQPAKQPIPVITPHGLVQTKLSTNSLNMSPKTGVRSNVIVPKPTYQIPPSIISHQYASQAYSFSKSGTNTTNHNQKSFDDDDWGEFVSSPLPSQSITNGFQQSKPHSSQHVNWSSSSPNIITNPHHFVQNGSSVSRKVPANNTIRRSAVQNLILPELDFVAPKARTSTSKKK